MQLIINERGDFGLCYEHSVCEGIPIVNMAHQIKKSLINRKTKDKYYFGMTPVPSRTFKISTDLSAALLLAEENILKLQKNLGTSLTYRTGWVNFLQGVRVMARVSPLW